MTPEDVKKYYKSGYRFYKETGMSQGTYGNWMRAGRIPLESQVKLHKLTKGQLEASLERLLSFKNSKSDGQDAVVYLSLDNLNLETKK